MIVHDQLPKMEGAMRWPVDLLDQFKYKASVLVYGGYFNNADKSRTYDMLLQYEKSPDGQSFSILCIEPKVSKDLATSYEYGETILKSYLEMASPQDNPCLLINGQNATSYFWIAMK